MSDARHEVYVSTDIETDGPIPGANSMLSFASIAYDDEGRELRSFAVNLETLPDAIPDARTMEWTEIGIARSADCAVCGQRPGPA